MCTNTSNTTIKCAYLSVVLKEDHFINYSDKSKKVFSINKMYDILYNALEVDL